MFLDSLISALRHSQRHLDLPGKSIWRLSYVAKCYERAKGMNTDQLKERVSVLAQLLDTKWALGECGLTGLPPIVSQPVQSVARVNQSAGKATHLLICCCLER